MVNVKGNIIDSQGQIANDYQGELTVTFYDKEIDRTTLGNDGTTDNLGNQILLNFKTLGETLFRGKSSVVDGEFDFDFIVPKDVGMEVDFGKFSFINTARYQKKEQEVSPGNLSTLNVPEWVTRNTIMYSADVFNKSLFITFSVLEIIFLHAFFSPVRHALAIEWMFLGVS